METSIEIDALDTPVIGTDDREARSLCWYAARTQMNCERKAEKEFKKNGIETYLPIQEEIHQWSDRKKKVQRIAIPMILFVKTDSLSLEKFHHTNYFYGFVSYDRKHTSPAPIPDNDINVLRFMLEKSKSPVSIEPLPVKLGDKVVITRGELKGLKGNVTICKEGTSHVVVNLNVLGCAKVIVDTSNIEILRS
jgi:transcription antitermination factor NusG